jgi:heterodisulfide reductase subunit A-like polyferredoxin
MALLGECEERGLMHSIWTFQTPFTAAICNCNLASGCMAMKLTAGYGVKIMWRGETVAQLDRLECSGCGECARLCPFGAIDASKPGPAVHDAEKCWGCGICRTGCPNNAITLVDRREVPAVAYLW